MKGHVATRFAVQRDFPRFGLSLELRGDPILAGGQQGVSHRSGIVDLQIRRSVGVGNQQAHIGYEFVVLALGKNHTQWPVLGDFAHVLLAIGANAAVQISRNRHRRNDDQLVLRQNGKTGCGQQSGSG